MKKDPDLGRDIGSYKITAVLGAGGMGKVYRATHSMIGKEVAIKLLNREHSKDQESVSRFFREARVANEIKHENIIDTLDFGQTPEGECYLVMELLSGKSVSRLIAEQNGEPLPQEKLAHIGLQLCSALYAAHQSNVIHRDIKSDNVFLVTRAGQRDFVKVLDFGIARINKEDASIATNTGTVLGTPLYLSPEQALGKKVGPQSDIYSLGVLFYLMACGAAPFYDSNPISLAMLHVMKEPAPLATRVPSINPRLDAVILRCLAKKIEARYQTMQELAIALAEACGVDYAPYFGLEPSAPRSGPQPALTQSKSGAHPSAKSEAEIGGTVASTTASREPKRPSYPLLAALGASSIAALIVAFFSFTHSEGLSPQSAAAKLTPATAPAAHTTPTTTPTTAPATAPTSAPAPAQTQPEEKKRPKLIEKRKDGPPPSLDELLIDPTKEGK